MPLAWAHAEYVNLLRSAADGKVYDRVPEVAERYLASGRARPLREVWKLNSRPRVVDPRAERRDLADRPCRLPTSDDEWRTVRDDEAATTSLGLFYVDLPALGSAGRRWVFTFYWTAEDRWEGRDFSVEAAPAGASDRPLTRP